MGAGEGCQGHEDANQLLEVECPKCGTVVEYFSHDKEVKCPKCGESIVVASK